MSSGMYALQLEPWLAVSTYTRTAPGSAGGSNAAEALSSDDATATKLDVKVFSISDIKGGGAGEGAAGQPAARVQATVSSLFEFVGLPPHDLEATQTEAKNTRQYAPMSEEVRRRATRILITCIVSYGIYQLQFHSPYSNSFNLLLLMTSDSGGANSLLRAP